MKIERTQAPVGYRVPAADVICAAFLASTTSTQSVECLERSCTEFFHVRQAFAVSSGKAALTLILRAVATLSGRRKVIVPAYTCFSLPSAIVKAGLEIVPCDIAQDSFDYDYTQLMPLLDSDVLCVLSVHLFGIPSDTRRTKDLCRGAGIIVVEDAAQAMGAAHGDLALGTLGDVGFFSLGRGKHLTSGGGGIILTSSPAIAAALTAAMRDVPAPRRSEDIRTLASLVMLSAFISPRLYWLPAGLPFLRLGETIFHKDFPIQRLSRFQAALLRTWPARLAALNETRRRNAEYYAAHIDGLQSADRRIPYLRFPLRLTDPAQKHRLLVEREGRKRGISGMYPSSVAGIAELAGRFDPSRFPTAERTANSLVTLPTHPLLDDAGREQICAAVNAVLASSGHQDARLAS